MTKLEDIIGNKFGRLTVIKCIRKDEKRRPIIECKCECGNTIAAISYNVVRGATKSCGCLQKEIARESAKLGTKKITKHRKSNTRLYSIWQDMKSRCLNKKSHEYKDYGARGITVCKEWEKDFLNFYNWAINNKYSKDLTIDRINVNGNYEPKNCRWATKEEQGNNRRNNHLIYYRGEYLTVTRLSKIVNISVNALINHNKKGDLEQYISKRIKFGLEPKYPIITKDFLEKELKTKAQEQISKEVGCGHSLIGYYKNKFKL